MKIENLEIWRCDYDAEKHYILNGDLELITFPNSNDVIIAYSVGAGCECITISKEDIVKMYNILKYEELGGINNEEC